MGAKDKRGKKGSAAQYLTRTQAIRKLQLSLGEFRRLCILKGIHPREPRKKPKGGAKTYYHVKDLAFLQHEPLLEVFRSIKVFQRKLRKAQVKRQLELVERLSSRKPGYTLDRLVRERYPSFVDALRDLDDPLCMVHLFAALPASKGYKIPASVVHTSARLSLEWQAYVARARALRKTFVTVKGFYYQAEVGGQQITWLVPHERSQVLPSDVDYRVMLTFLEFCETMLKFVLFKLYAGLGLQYPPKLDGELESSAAGLAAIVPETSRGQQEGNGEEGEASQEQGGLFADLVVFLNRETPRASLVFVIKSLGGAVGWEGEGSPLSKDDRSITHHVIDRPAAPSGTVAGREYVQPQWIYDSANFQMLLPVDLYAVGRAPPPHLSPFVDDEEEGYVPEFAQVVRKLKSAARAGGQEGEVGAEGEGADGAKVAKEVEGERYAREVREELSLAAGEGTSKGQVVAEEEEADANGKAEAEGQAGQEEQEMAGMLMTRKDRKLYKAVQMSKAAKRERVAKLQERRKKQKQSKS